MKYVKTFEEYSVDPNMESLDEGIFDSKAYDGHAESVDTPLFLVGVVRAMKQNEKSFSEVQKGKLTDSLSQISKEIGIDLFKAEQDKESDDFNKLKRKNPDVIQKLKKAYVKGSDIKNIAYNAVYFGTATGGQSNVLSAAHATVERGFHPENIIKNIDKIFKI